MFKKDEKSRKCQLQLNQKTFLQKTSSTLHTITFIANILATQVPTSSPKTTKSLVIFLQLEISLEDYYLEDYHLKDYFHAKLLPFISSAFVNKNLEHIALQH